MRLLLILRLVGSVLTTGAYTTDNILDAVSATDTFYISYARCILTPM